MPSKLSPYLFWIFKVSCMMYRSGEDHRICNSSVKRQKVFYLQEACSPVMASPNQNYVVDFIHTCVVSWASVGSTVRLSRRQKWSGLRSYISPVLYSHTVRPRPYVARKTVKFERNGKTVSVAFSFCWMSAAAIQSNFITPPDHCHRTAGSSTETSVATAKFIRLFER